MHFSKYRKILLFIMDLSITIGLYFLVSIVLINGTNINMSYITVMLQHLGILCACFSISLFTFKMYDSLWRYAESQEYLKLVISVGLAFLSYTVFATWLPIKKIPISVGLDTSSLSLLMMLIVRFLYRQYRKEKKDSSGKYVRLGIVGAGRAGVALLEKIQCTLDCNYQSVCFFDDDSIKIGKVIHGVKVVGSIDMIPQYCETHDINELIIAISSVSSNKRRQIIYSCSRTNCCVKILPDTVLLMEKQYDALMKSIRNVNIEDLLGRESIMFDDQNVHCFLKDKVVMVTGGGGSIGSQLCSQIMQCSPKQLVVIDICENSVYDLQQELMLEYGADMPLNIEIASVRDADKINDLFQKYHPQVVFHAAAHKHVPLMELCPEEAIKNNVFGTYNVVHAADCYHAEKFVLISTDKAVNPTNIMGATKRLCEMILQSMKEVSKTQFVAVRFGNVLGSNGSVIPLFKRQIEHGGPITITHKDIVRYFMTIPEAVQLVLQAATMAERSEVFVLDMGEPVKILDLAENMIRLSGHNPYKDIDIIETGLRPGEKLYEELLMASEDLVSTSNKKIFIERQHGISQIQLQKKLKILNEALCAKSDTCIRSAMYTVVPTFKDANLVNKKSFIINNNQLRLVEEKEYSVQSI